MGSCTSTIKEEVAEGRDYLADHVLEPIVAAAHTVEHKVTDVVHAVEHKMISFAHYLQHLGARRSQPHAGDVRASAHFATVSGGALPTIVDYRSDLGPAKDQGAQSACVGMAGSAMIEWWNRKNVGSLTICSPQFIYDFRENATWVGDTEGMTGRDLMSILTRYGDAAESLYPYGRAHLRPVVSKDIMADAAKRRCTRTLVVDSLDSMKACLAQNGPCFMIIPVYHDQVQIWRPQYAGQPSLGDHAVAVVGYNSQGFIVRNSWGPMWANCGNTIMPYADFTLGRAGSHVLGRGDTVPREAWSIVC